jgi:hypothetical protein
LYGIGGLLRELHGESVDDKESWAGVVDRMLYPDEFLTVGDVTFRQGPAFKYQRPPGRTVKAND